MEIFTLLETLEDILEKSKNVPFTTKSIVDKEEFLEKIEVYFSNERYKEFRNYVKRKQMLNITNFINSKNERVKTLIIFGFYIPLWKKRKHNSNKN